MAWKGTAMNKWIAAAHSWAGNTSGATAIEYSLIAAGVAMVIAGVVYLLGDNVVGMYTSVQAALQ